MVHAGRRLFAGAFVAVVLGWPGVTVAQGVIVPSPGSSSAATGPNSINPSAAASDVRNPNAVNQSAAPSAVTSPNALNPNATPSTFAPNISAPNSLSPQRRQGVVVRTPPRRGSARAARARRGAPTARAATRGAPSGLATGNERRARGIVNSVCRGC